MTKQSIADERISGREKVMDGIQDLVKDGIDACAKAFEPLIECITGKANADWLIQKCTLAGGILQDLKSYDATDPKELKIYHKRLEDIFCLYREIEAALPQACTGYLGVLGKTLSDLCLDLDAVENPASPRIASKMIQKAIENAKTCFDPKKTEKFKVLLSGDVYNQLTEALSGAHEACSDVLKPSQGAATSAHQLEPGTVESATYKIADISSRYQGLLHLLETFECRPDVEPPVLAEIRECLEEAGSFVVSALMTLNKISLEKEDCKSQLKKAWTTIHDQVHKLRQEIVRWAECQLCAPPDFCRETTGQLLSAAQKGLDRVSTLPSGPSMSIEARNGVVDLAKAFYEKLTDFKCKAESMTGFRMDVLTPFWWPLAQIKLVAEQCAKEEDPCHAMKLDLAKLFEILDALKGKTVGVVSGQDPGAVYTASVARVEMDQTCHEPWQTCQNALEKTSSKSSKDVQQLLVPLVEYCKAQGEFLRSPIAHQMDFEGRRRVITEGSRKFQALAAATFANTLSGPPLLDTDRDALTSLESQFRSVLTREL
jgi:hypothetical protein